MVGTDALDVCKVTLEAYVRFQLMVHVGDMLSLRDHLLLLVEEDTEIQSVLGGMVQVYLEVLDTPTWLAYR